MNNSHEIENQTQICHSINVVAESGREPWSLSSQSYSAFKANLLAGTSGSSSGSAGICCGELDASCRHPDGMIFADATWISDATNCNGHECPECPA